MISRMDRIIEKRQLGWHMLGWTTGFALAAGIGVPYLPGWFNYLTAVLVAIGFVVTLVVLIYEHID